jgi:hypothetical protein
MSGPVLHTEVGISGTPALDRLIQMELTAGAVLDLPGMRGSVDGAGFVLHLGIDLARQGPLGPLTMGTAVRRPTGMGVELTLPGARGGGYLAQTDNDLRGALTVDLGVFRVTGLGILGTRQPSLLVLLAAEFDPPVQLSFGFTLIGVGGVLGINRSTDLEELSRSVTSGDLGQLLFPRDPVAAAGRLLELLDHAFPFRPGGIVVGPMLKLGWGTPTLVSASIGVIADTANERVVLVGRLLVTLPFEYLAIVRIKALVLGSIDADGVAIDASLVNSTIGGATVEGDLRIRLRGGPGGVMALSAGGFHPAFTPPPGMAGMRRLSMSLSPVPILEIRLDAYLALTTASVQFGARLELRAGIDGFGIHGHAAFDALIVFEPTFGFTASLEAMVSIECADFDVASISLRGELAGTAPWRIRGRASVSVLFFDVSVDIPELTWGERATPPPPPRNPVAVLAEQLRRPETWSASSAAVPPVVQLRPGSPAPGAGVVHPLAALEVRQQAVPLDTPLQRMDGIRLPAPVVLRIVPADGDTLEAGPRASFVPAQFFDLDAAAQLGAAGVVDLPAGVALPARTPDVGSAVTRPWVYDQSLLVRHRRHTSRFPGAGELVTSALPQVLAVAEPEPLVTVREPHAVVVDPDTLTEATASVAVALERAGGTADLIGRRLTDTTAAGCTSLLEAHLAVQAFAGAAADRPAARAVQVVSAWEVTP